MEIQIVILVFCLCSCWAIPKNAIILLGKNKGYSGFNFNIIL